MKYQDLNRPQECRVWNLDSRGRTQEIGTAVVYKERLLARDALMPVVA